MSAHNVLVTLGTGAVDRPELDYYATDPKATRLLLELEQFNHNVLEPCCGGGHMAEVLKEHGYSVTASDIVNRGYGEVKDFFSIDRWDGDIVTNPPYKNVLAYTEHALDIIPEGNKLALFLRLQFLESKSRGKFFKDNPPSKVYVSRSKIFCARNGDFDNSQTGAMAFAWFVWEKGFKGDPVVKWFN